MDLLGSGGDISSVARDGFTGTFDGQPRVCAGFIEMWQGRARVWSVIDRRVSGVDMLPIHRAVMNAINKYQPLVYNRLEMEVMRGFNPGYRWARMLGFTPEGVMSHYDPWGNDYVLFSRVRR